MRLILFLILALIATDLKGEDIYHNPPSEEGAWPFTLELPACDDYYVIRKIMHDFENREREFWASDLFIDKFENVRETGLRDHGASYTPRRYCSAQGVFSDGLKRDVYFNITPDQSVILTGQVIDWCVVGLDHAHIDGPNCKRVTAK